MIELPSAVIFDTDNTLYPYEPAHQAATKAVEAKVENHLGIKKDRSIYYQTWDSIPNYSGGRWLDS